MPRSSAPVGHGLRPLGTNVLDHLPERDRPAVKRRLRAARKHGWSYLTAAIDCCTREIVGCQLELRCRATESIALVEQAVATRGVAAGTLTLGTDNGSAFTARAFKLVLSGLGVAHRRGGYRDTESQAFIESWFGKLKERCVWLHEFETLDEAREVIGAHRGCRINAQKCAQLLSGGRQVADSGCNRGPVPARRQFGPL
jgi:transposase InsO family protein